MNSIIDYLTNNKEWLFSGIGLFIITIIYYLFNLFKKKYKKINIQEKINVEKGTIESSAPDLSKSNNIDMPKYSKFVS